MAPSEARKLGHLSGILVLAFGYYLAGRLGLEFAQFNGLVSPVWPATGIALAALLLHGLELWPGITLGALAVSLGAGAQVLFAVAAACGNTLAALVGALLILQLTDFSNSLERVEDVLGLLLWGAIFGTMVSATVGAWSLIASGVGTTFDYFSVWWVWWVGDAMGVLLVAPLLLSWLSTPKVPPASRNTLEGLVLGGSLIATSQLLHGNWLPRELTTPMAFLVFPFVVWAAMRFGQRGGVASFFVATCIAIWGTVSGRGPFVMGSITLSLAYVYGFMGVVGTTALLLAASESERQLAHLERLRMQRELAAALTRVIGGFIPICSYCKSIRDESGEWMQIEAYVGRRSDAEFSHGICPTCVVDLYEEIHTRRGQRRGDRAVSPS